MQPTLWSPGMARIIIAVLAFGLLTISFPGHVSAGPSEGQRLLSYER